MTVFLFICFAKFTHVSEDLDWVLVSLVVITP